MSFLDDVKKREKESRQQELEIYNRMPAWAQAVFHLAQFIKDHLSDTAQPPAIRVESRTISVSGSGVEALTIAWGSTKASVLPLPLTDEKARGHGGCVVLSAGPAVPEYDLIWDGKSHAVADHWQIAQTARGSKANLGKPRLFSTQTFDDALRRLFDIW